MPAFEGFHPQDFDQLAGSSWRGRDALGGELARLMREQLGRPYESWGARRRLELHIALREHYDADHPDRCAKLFVYTHNHHTDQDELSFGFYVEAPPAGSPTSLQHVDWLRFRERLGDSPAMQTALLGAMANHALVLSDYYRAEEDGGAVGGKYTFRDSVLQRWLPLDETWAAVSAAELLHHLALLPDDARPGEWLNVHIFASLSRHRALEMGRAVIGPLLEVLLALAPVYELTVSGGKRSPRVPRR